MKNKKSFLQVRDDLQNKKTTVRSITANYIKSIHDNKDLNTYAITTVNPEKCKNIKSSAVEKIVTFLKSNNGKNTISKFRLNNANAFFPI